MTESIIVAVITGVLSLVGVVIANITAHQKTMAAVEKAQALTDQRLDQLTREVRAHNGLIDRMYAVEAKANLNEEKIKIVDRRIEELVGDKT